MPLSTRILYSSQPPIYLIFKVQNCKCMVCGIPLPNKRCYTVVKSCGIFQRTVIELKCWGTTLSRLLFRLYIQDNLAPWQIAYNYLLRKYSPCTRLVLCNLLPYYHHLYMVKGFLRLFLVGNFIIACYLLVVNKFFKVFLKCPNTVNLTNNFFINLFVALL